MTRAPDIEETPDLLIPQVLIIEEVLDALRIAVVGAPGCEADDVLGTLASRSSRPVDVVTGDRALFELVDDDRDVRVLYTGRGVGKLEILDEPAVVTKYGILPQQYTDFAVIGGDPSDGCWGQGHRREDRDRPAQPVRRPRRAAAHPGWLSPIRDRRSARAYVRSSLPRPTTSPSRCGRWPYSGTPICPASTPASHLRTRYALRAVRAGPDSARRYAWAAAAIATRIDQLEEGDGRSHG